MDILLIFTLAVILGAEFVNGLTDAPNAITTVVSTRALTFRKAVFFAALLNFAGVMSGTAVAATIGKGIVDAKAVDLVTISAAMISIVIWSSFAYFWRKRLGIPTSESHALVAGLLGAGLATAGPDALLWIGWKKVLIGLGFSTFMGLFGSYIFTKLVRKCSAPLPLYSTRSAFRKLQILSSGFMAFSHGSNDGQKFMGVFALALVLGGMYETFTIPIWVMVVMASIMALGTSIGGWRIIRTMGMRMTSLKPYQGFTAETAAASTITLASHFGIPLSTTHTINTSIMGASVAHRKSSLKMDVVRQIVLAWILTFPICGILAFVITHIARLVF
ncbi:MAG: inorganic phosphate transporter [Candidatus Spechtbacterales bacterium]